MVALHDSLDGRRPRHAAVRYAQRGVETDPAAPSPSDKPVLFDTVKWIGDNANHLLEQPILFYALCFAATLSGVDDGIFLIASWVYVVLRIVHSMWQSLINAVAVRFVLYIFFTLDLTYMAARFCFYLCVPGLTRSEAPQGKEAFITSPRRILKFFNGIGSVNIHFVNGPSHGSGEGRYRFDNVVWMVQKSQTML